MTRKRRREIHLRISERQFEHLEMARTTHGLESITQTVRTVLHAGFMKLGLEKDIEGLIEKK
jgi:hypothetical protein